MRVLLVVGAGQRGGAERALLALARHLPKNDIEPVVACLSEGPFVDELEVAGVEVFKKPVSLRARKVWKIPGVVRVIESLIAQADPEVVQASGEHVAIYCGWAARRTRRASVFWLHDSPLRSTYSSVVQLMMLFSPHDAVAVGSKWMAEAFHDKLRLKATPIPYGVEFERFPTKAADLRVETGWDPRSIVIGHFGRLQRWKGQEVFLHAAAQVAKTHPETRFLVVGGALYGWEQAYASSLPALAASLGIEHLVYFAGHREDALELMGACDVVVHSSLEPEPLGIVIPEAMGLGRAVVASRTLGPEEVIEDEVTGLLVAPADAEALSKALRRLIEDASFRLQLGAAALDAVRPYWSADRMASDFANLYRSLPGRTVPPR